MIETKAYNKKRVALKSKAARALHITMGELQKGEKARHLEIKGNKELQDAVKKIREEVEATRKDFEDFYGKNPDELEDLLQSKGFVGDLGLRPGWKRPVEQGEASEAVAAGGAGPTTVAVPAPEMGPEGATEDAALICAEQWGWDGLEDSGEDFIECG